MFSKGALAATAGAGMTGAAGTGAYYMGAFDGLFSGKVPTNTAIPQTLRELRKTDDLACMGDFIPELKQAIQQSIDDSKIPDSSKEITTENPLDMTFFKPTTYSLNNCLIINWDRKEGTKSKWYGNFRWFWGFTHGDQGFIMFSSLETPPSEPKLQVTGGVYLIQNGVNGKNNWQITGHKKLSSTITQEDFETKFPKVGDGIGNKDKFGDSKNLWGFVTKKEDMANICVNVNDCEENKLNHKFFRGRWEWKENGGTDKPTDWVKDFDGWISGFYPDVPKLKDFLSYKLSGMKGHWINKNPSPTAPQQTK